MVVVSLWLRLQLWLRFCDYLVITVLWLLVLVVALWLWLACGCGCLVVVVAVVTVVIFLWLWLLLWLWVADFVNPGFESSNLWLRVTAVVVVAVLLT